MKLFSRSDSTDQSELVDKQGRQRLAQAGLQAAQNGQMGKEETRRHLRELTDDELDEATLRLMSNLFSQDFLLSNLTDAEVKEIKWLARPISRTIKGMHPHHESAAQGQYRELVFGDDSLEALTPYQETLIDQAVLDFLTRPPRSREGWQQDELAKSYNVSKVEDDSSDAEKGSLLGR